jgi:hypothetical protein
VKRWLLPLSLPLATPVATAWVRRTERRVLARGVPLAPALAAAAARLGLRHPERVRVLAVAGVPWRWPGWLARRLGRHGLGPGAVAGLTAGYGILVRADRRDDVALLVHELAHVAQYERLGGIAPFVRVYLHDCARRGYAGSVLERWARRRAARSQAAGLQDR